MLHAELCKCYRQFKAAKWVNIKHILMDGIAMIIFRFSNRITIKTNEQKPPTEWQDLFTPLFKENYSTDQIFNVCHNN